MTFIIILADEFPINLVLPYALPRSMNFCPTSGGRYEIKYYIKVRLALKGIFNFDVKDFREIKLHEKPWNKTEAPMFKTTDKFKASSCFSSGGYARLITKTDNTQICRYDNLFVHVLLSTDADIGSKFAEVSLIEHFSFPLKFEYPRKRILNSIVLNVTSDVKLDDIEEAQKTMLENQYIAKFRLVDVEPSFQSLAGDLSYEISVKSKNCCFIGYRPSVTIPIIIHPPNWLIDQQLQMTTPLNSGTEVQIS